MNITKSIDVVFLGGSCNLSSWRQDIAIPYFENYRILYYNPQVDNWTPDLVQQEDSAKKNCKCLLFVINDEIRSVASLVEVAYLSAMNKNIVLVMGNNFKNELKKQNDEKIDLWKARKIIGEIMLMNGLFWTGDIFEALELCAHIIFKPSIDIKSSLSKIGTCLRVLDCLDKFEYYDICIYVSEDLADWKYNCLLPTFKSKNLKYFDCVEEGSQFSNKLSLSRYSAIKKAKMLLYVIGAHSRSPHILVEAAHFSIENKKIVLSVENLKHIPHSHISEAEISDYNRGRYYLMEMARSKGIPTLPNHNQVIQTLFELNL